MATRITGLTSGLDTEALVSAMVMNYRAKVTKNEKAQTSLSYKMDALKSVNTDVYNLFGAVDKMRWSSAYSMKTTSVSDATKAKVTAGETAVNGTQTLEITQLAQAGYLTGGNVKSKAGALSTSTKLSDITSTTTTTDPSTGKSTTTTNEFKGGSITVTAKGKDTTINFYEGMTAQNLVNTLKDAGLNASFDADNGRFFISSKESGEGNDFSLVANDTNGMESLKALGLYTVDENTKAKYKEWADYEALQNDPTKWNDFVDAKFAASKVTPEARAASYAAQYNAAMTTKESAQKSIDTILDKYNDETGTRTINNSEEATKKANDKINTFTTGPSAAYLKDEEIDDGKGGKTTIKTFDLDKLKADLDAGTLRQTDYDTYIKVNDEIKDLRSAAKELKTNEDSIAAQDTKMTELSGKVYMENGKAVALTADNNATAYGNIVAEVDAENAAARTKLEGDLIKRIDDSKKALAEITATGAAGVDGAVRKVGRDAKILLNDAEFTSSSNNFSINGLSIEATAETEKGKPITITTGTDNQGIYDKIKDFIQQYNDVINKINKLYNAPSAKGYNPLSEDEKAAMSDTEVAKWESKIKDSILRRDSTIGDIINSMSGAMSGVFDIGGKNYSLSNFGIKTLGYFSSKNNENYAFHIDGDSDDGAVSGNADKLMAAIVKDPETVVSFFQKLSSSLYDSLNAKMKSSTLSSAYVIYNDKEMASEYSDYTSTIAKWQDKVATQEEAYYKKFAAMEKTLTSLQSQTSSLSGYFG